MFLCQSRHTHRQVHHLFANLPPRERQKWTQVTVNCKCQLAAFCLPFWDSSSVSTKLSKSVQRCCIQNKALHIAVSSWASTQPNCYITSWKQSSGSGLESHSAHATHTAAHATHTSHVRFLFLRELCDDGFCCGEQRGDTSCIYQGCPHHLFRQITSKPH